MHETPSRNGGDACDTGRELTRRSDIKVDNGKRERGNMMGQRLRSWCLVIGALGACILYAGATGRADVVVSNNQLVSSIPGLKVIVTPGFRYIGETQFTTTTELGDQTQGSAYVFIENAGDQVKRIFYVKLIPELLIFPFNLLGNIAADLDSGFCVLTDRQYQCTTKLLSFSGNEPVPKFISPQGYFLPPCLLAKSFVASDPTTNNWLVGLFYLEGVSQSLFDCRSWKSTPELSSAQKKYLSQFEQNWMNAFATYSWKTFSIP
jgi:hypothetical protein